MPYMYIDGKMTEVPVGFNPLTHDFVDGKAVSKVQQLNNTVPPEWQSQNKPALAGNPMGYQYDPRFQQGYTKEERDAYTNWNRSQFGLEGLNTTPITGLAGQTAQAGGDLAAMAERTRQPGYGMGAYSQPMTADARAAQLANPNLPPAARPLVESAPTSAPGVKTVPGSIPPSAPASPPPTTTGGAGTGPFTPKTTTTNPFGNAQQQVAGSPYNNVAAPPPTVANAPPPAVTTTPKTTGGYQQIVPESTTNRAGASLTGGVGYEPTPETSEAPAPAPPVTTAAPPPEVPPASDMQLGGTLSPDYVPPAPYVPGGIVAQQGLLANQTGTLESIQKANRFNNVQNYLWDMLNTGYLGGMSPEQALQLGNQQLGDSPETAIINQILQQGLPGQQNIQDISDLLMNTDQSDPLSSQSRTLLSQILSGQVLPENMRGIERGVGEQLGLSSDYQNQFQGLMDLNPDILNRAYNMIQGQGAGQNPDVEAFIKSTLQGGVPGLNQVSQFAGQQMQEGLRGETEDAMRRRYYEPAREKLLGDLSQRGVLDSGQRMKEESDLLNQGFLDNLILQDQAARERGADLFGQTAMQQQGAKYDVSGLGNQGRGLNLQAAGTLGNLGGLNLQAANQYQNAGQGAFGNALQGYGTTNDLMRDLLGMSVGAGGGAEERALNRVQTGMGGYGQIAQNAVPYFNLAQQGTLGRAGLGLDAARFGQQGGLQDFMARTGLAGDIGGRELTRENMTTQNLVDLINAFMMSEAGKEQAAAGRSSAAKQLIGAGMGAVGAAFSSEVFKRDIKPADDEKEDALARVNSIPLSRWRFRQPLEDGKEHFSWINENVDPEFKSKDGMYMDEYSILGHLVASIQALTAEVNELRKKVKDA